MITTDSPISTMTSFISDGPLVAVFAFLLVVVFCRAQGTYWLGRYMGHFIMTRGKPANGWRLRAYEWIHSDSTTRGIDTLQRRGWPVIPLSFLTVGFQTIINLGAGVIGMPWLRYTPAMIPGCLAWAGIYATVGWAVWEVAFVAAAGSPYGIVVIIVLLALLVWFIVRKTKAGKRAIAQGNPNATIDIRAERH